ncbi:DUF2163 domain-containing protein [Ideonella paludis]|uniref:DUF2163 domain-containing protein n=1 Tax=Ideonella paludis TaxID=1233411 RepID=UPI0036384BDE
MKTASPALTALINSGKFERADVYTIALKGGLTLRYADHDQPLTFGAETWTLGPLLKRSRTELSVGIEVDEMEVTFTPTDFSLINGKPFAAFVSGGGFSGARLTVQRAYTPRMGDVVGLVHVFSGRVSDAGLGGGTVRVVVRSDAELLDAMVPANVYQPGCLNGLYDDACGISRAAHQAAASVTGAQAPSRSFFSTSLPQAAGHFSMGTLTFTSGPNAGVSRTVKQHLAGGALRMIAPLPITPGAGDAFTIAPGCDGTRATCGGRYFNLNRFRGTPLIPVAETIT